MLKINKKVEYALIALKLMLEKKREELTTAREVSDKFKTPFDTTAKVMQVMNNAEILASVKGVKGGYYLNRELSRLSYMDLAELIEGKPLAMNCEDMRCQLLGTCNISGPLTKLSSHLDGFLRNLSVEELLNETYAVNLNNLNGAAKETMHEL